jgi:hypothetical protein
MTAFHVARLAMLATAPSTAAALKGYGSQSFIALIRSRSDIDTHRRSTGSHRAVAGKVGKIPNGKCHTGGTTANRMGIARQEISFQ